MVQQLPLLPHLRAPHGGVPLPYASLLDSLMAAEQLRSVRRYGGVRNDAITARTGSSVLLTAPHAVAHWRQGTRKPADLGTGFIVDALAAATGATSVVADGEQSGDGNFESTSLFRREVAARLAGASLVLDVHGMSDSYGMDVCLGTGGLPVEECAPVPVLREALEVRGFVVSVNDPYDAARNDTVTRHAVRSGRPAVQIELARRVRRHADDPGSCLLLVQALAAAVAALS